MSPIAYTAAIIAVVVVLFVWNRLPVVVVAMATAMALWATGVLTIGQALGGFGDPAVIFIASLFVVSSGLEVTGVTAWAGQLLIRGAGEESRTRLLILTMSLVALLTALISVNGAVAALAAGGGRHRRPPEAEFVAAAHAAGLLRACRLDAGADRHAGERAGLGGRQRRWRGRLRLLRVRACRRAAAGRNAWRSSYCSESSSCPSAMARPCPPISAAMPQTLVEQYGLASGIYQMRVRASSPFVGMPASAIDLGSPSRTAACRRSGG